MSFFETEQSNTAGGHQRPIARRASIEKRGGRVVDDKREPVTGTVTRLRAAMIDDAEPVEYADRLRHRQMAADSRRARAQVEIERPPREMRKDDD